MILVYRPFDLRSLDAVEQSHKNADIYDSSRYVDYTYTQTRCDEFDFYSMSYCWMKFHIFNSTRICGGCYHLTV